MLSLISEYNQVMSESNVYMKPLKLKIHSNQNSNDDALLFNSSDFPKIKQNDFVKIFQHDDSLHYLLFQVKTLKDGVVARDYVSIEQTLANKNGLQVFHDVFMVQVEPEDVTIDLLEVSFKDQYISRSDMWRMKKHLVNSCVSIDQSLNYTDVRAQVSELWVNSRRARCGFISDNTNFVLRSYTAKVYVFVQMSSEMWDYDTYGYLQFERAIDGFLKALFTKWKEKKCCHELTLVLFSRTFYETKEISEFPEHLQGAVRTDYQGRLYMDFYKCVVQSEKLEDCTPLLNKLKKLVHKYDELTQLPDCPLGINSNSAQGNFLEAINMSLNVFERHNVDRNFDGTGQIVVCITPGVGVFDVDREMTILTKERMIDNGIGSDLICLGQQPLHAVPLFKFHQKRLEWLRSQKTKLLKKPNQLGQYDFNIPHWINHSFYTSNPFTDKGTTNIKFVPRINASLNESFRFTRKMSTPASPKPTATDTDALPTIKQLSFAEYDKQVFRFHKPSFLRKPPLCDPPSTKHSTPDGHKKKLLKTSDLNLSLSPDTKRRRSRPVHIPLHKSCNLIEIQNGLASSLGAATIRENQIQQQKEDEIEGRPVIGSATMYRKSVFGDDVSPPTSRRALFNPFNPLQMFAPLTANRRRWVHTYPRGPQGEALVLHHRSSSKNRMRTTSHRESESTDEEVTLHGASGSPISVITGESPVGASFNVQHSLQASGSFDDASIITTKATSSSSFASSKSLIYGGLGDHIDSSSNEGDFVTYKGFPSHKPISSYGLSWMWGIAGDIQWTTDTYTGLDWKSLKCPACLPITTDYCPKQSDLQSSYTEHSYTLIPDETPVFSEKFDEDVKLKSDSSEKEFRSAKEIFLELINQRLCQGFQMIKKTTRARSTDSTSSCNTLTSPTFSDGSFRSLIPGTSPMYLMPSLPVCAADGDNVPNGFMLSHGRQYHILRLSPEDDKIEVKIYKQRHPSVTVAIDYSYMLWPKTRGEFQTTRICFAHNVVEDSYWNHLDDYICSPDCGTFQNAVYWRTKFVAVAAPAKRLHMLKTANENKEGRRFDVFTGCGCKTSHKAAVGKDECAALTEGFVRFLGQLNKLKRNLNSNARKSFRPYSNSLSKSFQPTSTGSGTIGSNHATPTPPRATSSTPNSDRSTPVRPPLEFLSNGPPPTLSDNPSQRSDIQHPVPMKSNGTVTCCVPEVSRVSVNSDMSKIVEAMKDSQSGLTFLLEKEGIPKHTFVSVDAVHWSVDNVDGINSIKEACDHFDCIRSYGFLSHISGDREVPFSYGYSLFILNNEKQPFEMDDPSTNQYQDTQSNASLSTSKNHFFEVDFKRHELETADLCPHHNLSSSFDAPEGKSGAFHVPSDYKSPNHEKASTPISKLVKISMRNQNRTSRSEWCQFTYSSAVHCGVDTFVFCFELQWLIATATCLFNMLQVWYRDAARCDLYFFPVPCRPFAFPSTGNAGPLRCPLFVPLDVNTLLNHSTFLKDLLSTPEKYRAIIKTMMKEIILRFGFLCDEYKDYDIDSTPNPSDDSSLNFIHFTGQVLAQIPIRSKVVQRNSINPQPRRTDCKKNLATAPPPPVTQDERDSVGFYWTFNHMMSKRWRLPVLDECPPSELEKDFISFCANDNSRLVTFFDEVFKR